MHNQTTTVTNATQSTQTHNVRRDARLSYNHNDRTPNGNHTNTLVGRSMTATAAKLNANIHESELRYGLLYSCKGSLSFFFVERGTAVNDVGQ